MSHRLHRIGRLAARRPWVAIGAWLLVAAIVLGSSAAFGSDLEDSFEVPGQDSQRAAALLTEGGSDRAGLTAQLVATPRDGAATFSDSAAARNALAELQAGVARLPHVLATGGERSSDGRVAVLRLQYPGVDELAPSDLEDLKAFVTAAREGSPLTVEMGGDLFFAFEESPVGLGEAIGLAAAVVILFVAFGSLVAMAIPIAMALFGLAVGMSAMALLAHVIEIPSWAPQLGAMIGLGVGIDYALFVLTRHREHLAGGMTVEESAGRAVATAGRAVVFAGGTVVIAILGLAAAGIPFLTAGGVGISIVVLVMVATSVTLLPAFLRLAGPRVTARGRRRVGASADAPGPGWQRWGGHVSRHAAAYAAGGTILLLALAAPALDLRLGSPDEGTLPETRTERRAYDLVADGLGPGANGPLVVAVDIAGDPGVVELLRAAIAADPGVARVLPAVTSPAAGVASLVVHPTTAPQDEATLTTIRRLRSAVLPRVLGDGPAQAHVGGHTATWADIGQRLQDRMPLVLGGVILPAFLLLVLVFRSVLVPLKAALLNLLSVGAAYGVLVMVFQWGWGADLIGLESTIPVIPFIPLFMFAILFGLSMDYEVFLLSRIRERYLRTGDNGASVIHGIASTARVITAAALIMMSVFLSFVLGDDPRIKMFGLGLATAIFVDATIVRLVVVPATMKLLGEANWWLPAWLDRLLPPVRHDGQPAAAESPPLPAAGGLPAEA